MADHKLYYDGPDGAINREVADAAGGSAVMERGKHYEGIPEELAVRLLLTADWHEMRGKEKLAKKVQELVEAEDSRVQPGAAAELAETPPEPPPEPPAPPEPSPANEGGNA